MTDRALSKEAMLAGLRDIHLPSEAAGGAWAEMLAAAGIGGVAALLAVLLIRAISLRARPVVRPSLRDRVAALADLPETERRVALLHLLKTHAPERFAAEKQALYRPKPPLEADDLARELLRHA